MEFTVHNQALYARHRGETLCIEPWGNNALRVRATMQPTIQDECWALTEIPVSCSAAVSISQQAFREGDGSYSHRPFASIRNGRIRADVNFAGVISFYRDDILILREYYRSYDGTLSEGSRCLKIVNREWKGIPGATEHRLTVRFDSNPGEKLYGMGQYQQSSLNLKGCMLELAQRNSQITIPFYLSSQLYGFLWNNPAVGRAVFAKNITEWLAESTTQMDYWITVGDTPREILFSYTSVTGRAPSFPRDRMGLWQCKLRYRTQEEVLEVARRYTREGIQLDQIVIDFFHWTVQGDWKFDCRYWPDPAAMVRELHQLGIKVIVSVWPSVDRRSVNFYPMMEKGLLIRTERGAAQTYDYQGDCVEIDVFNPEARQYIWEVCNRNYASLGIDAFWLDNSEPDYGVYDFDHYRYYSGPALAVSNLYPQLFSRSFYEPMVMQQGEGHVVNLLRCGWAGSQKYGNVIWSGDVPSTFSAFREQLQCGLNMGMAGIPWWTSDIGGFMTDDVNNPDFHQLLIRWYQFAVYSAVLRMHGDRGPYNIPPLDYDDKGGGYLHTGQPNELWSYGPDVYAILKKYYDIRICMKDYIAQCFEDAHRTGAPLIRPMFFEYPSDPHCWETEDQYMFGDRYLVAPVTELNVFKRSVYLPEGQWKNTETGHVFKGHTTIMADAPIETIPVFEKL